MRRVDAAPPRNCYTCFLFGSCFLFFDISVRLSSNPSIGHGSLAIRKATISTDIVSSMADFATCGLGLVSWQRGLGCKLRELPQGLLDFVVHEVLTDLKRFCEISMVRLLPVGLALLSSVAR